MSSVLEFENKCLKADAGKCSSIFIGGIEKFSVVDYPGKIAAVVFLKGCPWRCPFCYNTHLQKLDNETNFFWHEFKHFLEKRKGVLDAVVFSGGEPLMQKRIVEAIVEVKALGFEIGVHTGGFYPEILAETLPLVDWVGLDIKAPFESEHYKKAVGGVESLPKVLQSLDILLKSRINFETRTTCDPRLLTVEDIYCIAKALSARGVKKYNLQRYRQVEGDTTSDEACEIFFKDEKLIDFLEANFEVVEFRK
ncbi:MAG: anaerobic ribonucleoside-triphosphate reductase activating protein [Alphaproteobacteria bacterium]|nr:anaerobic ribonucleoside-triphosphate reductase activating protein [Alphaproteobacteria bacterium]